MAGELERLLIRVEADTAQLRRALAQADSAVGSFSNSVDRKVSSTERRFASMSRSFKAAIGVATLVQVTRATADMADQYQNMENRLSVVAKSAGDLELTQRRLLEIAQETRVGVGDTAEMYSRYAFALKDAGKTTNEVLDFTEALQKAVVLSGASTQEAAGALRQFGQGLASGVLRGQELNSVMEQMPPIADLIAKKLGVTTGELRKLAEQGAITREVAFDAIMEGMTDLDDRFKKTTPTISQSFEQIKNSMLDLGEVTGVFDAITKRMQVVSETFQYMVGRIKGVSGGTVAGASKSVAGIDRFSFGQGMQGNIRPPAQASGGLDPWAASIIPPSVEEQLAEMKQMWDEVHQAQLATLDDLVGDKTETAATKMAALTAAVKDGSIAWSDFGDMTKQVQAQTEQANDDMLSSTSNFLDSMFQNNKTAATASALINTYQGITKALSAYPPPYSYAMAAMQAAMGFAQVRSIQSTSRSSRGGSVSVPRAGAVGGGAGGAGGVAAGPQQSQTLNVQLGSMGSLMDRRGIRELLERIQEAQRDGYRLVLT